MSEARTERPTPRRRREARRRGRVPRSLEIVSASVLLAMGLFATLLAPTLLDQLEEVLRAGIGRAADPAAASREGLAALAWWAARALLVTAGPPIALAAAIGLAVNLAQVGFRFTPLALQPTLSKLHVLRGLKRLLGYEGGVEAAKAATKTALVALAALAVLAPRLGELAGWAGAPPGLLVGELGSAVRELLLAVGGAFLAVAAFDYGWQRFRHERSLRMTKEELRQELRQTEVAPEVKRALRRRQLALARRRMLAEVATADVVVTNPTHVAVALRYDGTLPAPQVVAKGAGVVAQAIRRAAAEHRVPLVRNPPLAQALYRQVEVGRLIPEAFFAAVAEILAFVYRTSGRWPRLKRAGKRPITRAHAVRPSSPPR